MRVVLLASAKVKSQRFSEQNELAEKNIEDQELGSIIPVSLCANLDIMTIVHVKKELEREEQEQI